MAFWGCKFSFDGVSCDDHQLMLYSIGKNEHEETQFAHVVKISEEHVGGHWKPLFFGVTYENKLETEIVFGVNQERLDNQEPLTRQEMAEISSWLAGHDQYKWFEVEQEDMQGIRYRCMITKLNMVEYGGVPWAFKATITCDGPYAYMLPQTISYTVNGELEVDFYNLSDHNGMYSPVITLYGGTAVLTEENDEVLTEESDQILTTTSAVALTGSFVIQNMTTGQTMAYTNIPASVSQIITDCEHGVITANTQDNMYKYFNFQFLRLKKGKNHLKFTGTGVVDIQCEFPVSVGL